MNRTLRLKLLFVVALLGLGSLAVIVVTSAFEQRRPIGAALVALAFLLPGRIQGFFYRDLFRGRRLLEGGKPQEAIAHFQAFLQQMRAKPWLKRLIWLSWTVYTPSAEAMAWNNIGAAHSSVRRWEDAKAAFETALSIDDAYPLPHLNLARIALVAGDREEANARIATATKLGYVGASTDQLVAQLQSALAKVEGRGESTP